MNNDTLSHLSLAILLALLDGDRHGYGIMKEIGRLTDGDVRAGAGSLYAALQRMTAEGLVEEVPAEGETDGRRRYYGITARGREVARSEMLRMVRALEVAHHKKLLPGLRLTLAEGGR